MTEPAVHLSLANAMRRGTSYRPQAHGRLFGHVQPGAEPTASCALVAAYEGIHGRVLAMRVPEFIERICATFPELDDDREFTAPCDCRVKAPGKRDQPLRDGLYNLCAHLTDKHRWPRERTAAWLEELGF